MNNGLDWGRDSSYLQGLFFLVNVKVNSRRETFPVNPLVPSGCPLSYFLSFLFQAKLPWLQELGTLWISRTVKLVHSRWCMKASMHVSQIRCSAHSQTSHRSEVPQIAPALLWDCVWGCDGWRDLTSLWGAQVKISQGFGGERAEEASFLIWGTRQHGPER